ncbi:hypothetical protein CKAH01_18506 [Colletotrichum kahawae]|uniref:Uncharacterized protein n=1 Tax=Colletotrichum kahawae TaxID=34407 RepID=A0AAD9Y7R1_COLKA|nr:hypothetical protein CKAH01_18506 [Colletotrichum kahawae]
MTKRKRSAEDTTPARYSYKRRASDDPFQDQKSAWELAKPYLLATARLHIDIIDITWSKGINYRIEPSHVRKLQEVFMKGGLERSAPENHISGSSLCLETFNISTFEWMASLCVDGYWFATLEAVLDTLNALPFDVTQDVGLGDWDMLCDNTSSAPRRMGGLLRTLDDEAYKRVYTAVSAAPNLSFVDLKRFLRPKRLETETVVCVLYYVVSWIDSRSAAELADVNPKSKNKPLLLEHLQAALANLSAYRDSTAYAENTAAWLQRRMLDLAIHNADAFWAQEVITDADDAATDVLRPDANESVSPSLQRHQRRLSLAANIPPPSAQKNIGSCELIGHRAGLSYAEVLRVLLDVEGRASSISPR